MDAMLRLALWFSSGNAFFAGAVLIVTAAGIRTCAAGRAAGIAGRLCAAIGALFVALSATPFPMWFYAIWAAAIIWLLFESNSDSRGPRRRLAAALAAVAVTVAGAAWEAPFGISPKVTAAASSRLVIVGDSITAGVNGNVATWPAVLARRGDRKVVDLSAPGLTMATAVPRVKALPPQTLAGSTVLLEIGGNDMLERIDSRRFESDLDELLQIVSRPKTKVVLMELPLPPFFNNYGRIQRRLAARYGAVLLPKRRFAGVIALEGGTLDGLHLSGKGQEMMAAVIASVIEVEKGA